jgi:hypothetical protein
VTVRTSALEQRPSWSITHPKSAQIVSDVMFDRHEGIEPHCCECGDHLDGFGYQIDLWNRICLECYTEVSLYPAGLL